MKLDEAAKLAKGRDGKPLAPVSLRAAAARGALRARKNGDVWVVTESDLRAYLNSRPRWWRPGGR